MTTVAQLRVKTQLQQDYNVENPVHLQNPVNIDPWTKGGGYVYPVLHAATDENGYPSVFFDSTSSILPTAGSDTYKITNIYWDGISQDWKSEDTGLPQTPAPVPVQATIQLVLSPFTNMTSRKNPRTGRLSVACVTIEPVGQNGSWPNIWFLNGDSRWSNWTRSRLGNPSLSGFGNVYQSHPEIVFGDDGSPLVYISQDMGRYTSQVSSVLKMWKWDPISGQPPSPVESEHDGTLWPGTTRIRDLNIGTFWDPANKPGNTPVQGAYLVARDTSLLSNADKPYWDIYRMDIVDNGMRNGLRMFPKLPHFFNNVSCVYLPGANTVPLLFATVAGSGVVWLPNFTTATAPATSNYSNMFTDIEGYPRTAVWVEAIITQSDVSDAQSIEAEGKETAPLEPFAVHVVAAFQSDDRKTLELWHTTCAPGTLTEVQDGVYGFNTDPPTWEGSVMITNDILWNNKYNFRTADCSADAFPDRPFSLFDKGGNAAVAVVNQNLQVCIHERGTETATWVETILESQATTPPPTQIVNTYFLELAAVMPDGTPLGMVNATLGSDTSQLVKIDNMPVMLGPGNSYSTQFGNNGLLAVEMPANDMMVPPSFWIEFEGMDPGDRITVQPEPDGLHAAMSQMNTQGHGLDDIYLKDGTTPLMPPKYHKDPSIADANTAMAALGGILTVEEDEDGAGASGSVPPTRRHIYKSTPKHVARGTAGGKAHSLGKVRGNRNFGMVLDFKNEFRCRVMNRQEMMDYEAQQDQMQPEISLPNFEDLGALWTNVKSGVVSVATISIKALDDTVEATIHWTRDQLNGLGNFVMDLASHIGEVAALVLDKFTIGFDRIFAWLGHIFAWDTIVTNAKTFQTNTLAVPGKLQTWLDGVKTNATTLLNAATDDAIDGWFNSLSGILGTDNINSLTSASKTEGAYKGGLGAYPSGQEAIDEAPSSASWLSTKCIGAINMAGSSVDGTAVGSSTALANFETIFKEVDAAIANNIEDHIKPITDMLKSLTSQDGFEKLSLQTLLSAFKDIMKFGVGVARTAISAFIDLMKWITNQLVNVFNTPITFPPVVWLYSQIPGAKQALGDKPTLLGLCCLVTAVPYTILSGILQLPSSPGTTTEKVALSAVGGKVRNVGVNEKALYASLGALTVTESLFGLIGEGMQEWATFQEEQAAEARMKQIGPEVQVVGTAITISPAMALSLPSSEASAGDTDVSTIIEDIIISFDFVTMTTTIVRLFDQFVVGKTSFGKKRAQWYSLAKAVGGVGSLGMGIYELVKKNQVKPVNDVEIRLAIGAFLGGVRDSSFVLDLFVKYPPVRVGAAVARFGCGVTQGALYCDAARRIAASEEAEEESPARTTLPLIDPPAISTDKREIDHRRLTDGKTA